MFVVGYTRTSTPTQKTGASIQLAHITRWCASNDKDLLQVWHDTGSDYLPNLEDLLRKLLFWAEATLVIYRVDRLGRTASAKDVLVALFNKGVRVVSTSENLDSAVSTAPFFEAHTFARNEREIIRARLLDGRRLADCENRVYASEPRYGRRTSEDGKTLTIDPDEAAIIDKIRSLRAEGRSYRAICDALADAGHLPRRAEKWSPSVVCRIATGTRAPKLTRAERRQRLFEKQERLLTQLELVEAALKTS